MTEGWLLEFLQVIARSEKATRGRVRTPKAAQNQIGLLLILHEVLESAMRPRIAFR